MKLPVHILGLVLFAGSLLADDKPNIIFILADDHGFGALSATGAEGIKTPNVDRIAIEGMQFESFYVHNRCSPSRMAFMTGSMSNRVGYSNVIYRKSLVGINDEEITTPELLKQAGYATGIVGKWHLCEYEQFNPVNHGFDSFYGFMKYEGEKSGIYRDRTLVEQGLRITDGVHSEKLRDAGIEFIRANRDRPFFLYYASPLPHVKWMPSERFKGTSGRGDYGDVMQELDWQVGGLLDALDEMGLAENTLVIYTADNGPQLGIGGEESSSGIYRDGKWTNFEGGIRVPCFMRWPGKIAAGGSNDEITAIYDLLPTFCEIADITAPLDRVLDGESILPYLLGEERGLPIHEAFFVADSTYRYRDWKFLAKGGKPGGQERYWGPRSEAEAGSLFNLKTDPGESTDLSGKHPDVVKDLERRLEEAMKELNENSREIGRHPDYSSVNVKGRKKARKIKEQS
ncbi:MAG: sulfatase-like hydrolase/transferase [Verrucomicrobiota bacterium]